MDNRELGGYNLSYSFMKNVLGIDPKECYPFKSGYIIIDQNGNNYLIFKIVYNQTYKYINIYDILKYILNKESPILEMYSFNYKRYFVDRHKNENYVLFEYSKGSYKKWEEFNLHDIFECLRDFYDSSYGILNGTYLSRSTKYSGIVTLGSECNQISRYVHKLNEIKNSISLKDSRSELDDVFLNNRDYMMNELCEINRFFGSKRFRSYMEDHNNIRFINGNLSNRSFICEDRYKIANFYSSSIDLFIRDMSKLIYHSIFHIDHNQIKTFILDILNYFGGNRDLHIEVLINYIRLENNIFDRLLGEYICDPLHFKCIKEDKNLEFNRYIDFQRNFIDEMSST